MPNQQPTPTPSLLLTKRLTAFLSANLGPQVHTAVLTTLSGKLLAHASPHPVGTLRTQCTVAASIWALYSSPDTVVEALPQSQPQPPSPHPPSVVTIQLTAGVMVIRKLRCGLLFVCIGPSTSAAAAGSAGAGEGDYVTHTPARTVPQQQQQHSQHQQLHQHQSQQQLNTNNNTEPHPQTPLGSPSEVESVVSAGAATTASVATTTTSVAAAAVVATRRQAEELARWLDDKLSSLGTLEEGLGVETR
ncbi:uncharacterized protein F4812DRAFT_410298 [Daldinia caldariorum]|uniref:uncharacterized protein n=1 Tax=Daldinia caldariorum TaxID=326644 RepID=UPI0020088EB0|nr:uncharacterized protein F4812DRAFT_410298 [Daldinia caldariorum]KAI1472798.1 hypothetical protein F4812DRAFT_410298 [Daldinia caldariorum]